MPAGGGDMGIATSRRVLAVTAVALLAVAGGLLLQFGPGSLTGMLVEEGEESVEEQGLPTVDAVVLDYSTSPRTFRYQPLSTLLEQEFRGAAGGAAALDVEAGRHVRSAFHLEFATVEERYPHLRDLDPRRSRDIRRIWYHNRSGTLADEAAAAARNVSGPGTDLAIVLTDLQMPGSGMYTATTTADGEELGVVVVEGLALEGWKRRANYSRQLLSTPAIARAAIDQISRYHARNLTGTVQDCGAGAETFCPAAIERIATAADRD